MHQIITQKLMWYIGPLPNRHRHRSLLRDLAGRPTPFVDRGLACLQGSVVTVLLPTRHPNSPSQPFLGLGTWISPPHEDAFGPSDFLQDVQDGMAAAAVLLQEGDVPMPWECNVCQYHKHDFTMECERRIEPTTIAGASVPVVRGREKRYACPGAGEYGCGETYATKQSATRHSRTAYHKVVKRKVEMAIVASNSMALGRGGGEGFACPHAERFGCTKTFTSQLGAAGHSSVHGVRGKKRR